MSVCIHTASILVACIWLLSVDWDKKPIKYTCFGMATPADNRKLRKIIYTATGYGILTKAEIALIAKIVGRAIDRELEKTEGSSQ